jgi:hypothetical protein
VQNKLDELEVSINNPPDSGRLQLQGDQVQQSEQPGIFPGAGTMHLSPEGQNEA